MAGQQSFSKMMSGSPILLGSHTTPGVRIPPEFQKHIPTLFQAARDAGLDFYPTVVEPLTYDEISEIAAYGGFPVRYPHWRFGMEYEELARGYELSQHRIFEMVVNCCDPGTRVLTNNGGKSAEDVLVGDLIFGPSGLREVAAIVRQPKSQVMAIHLEEFGHDVICTPNHKWKCVRNGGAVWVRTQDIQPGDAIIAGGQFTSFLGLPALLPWSPDRVVESTRKNVRCRLLPITPPSVMTIELAELMGVLTGDGSIGVRMAHQMLSVCIHKPLVEYKNHVKELFFKVFGREATIQEKKRSVDCVTLCSVFGVDFLNSIGFKAGCTFNNKRIPWSIISSSNEYRAAFIRGLFDTDGYAGKYLSVSCKNRDLAKDIQLVLLEMGIRTKFFHVKNNHNDIFTVSVKGQSNLRKFRQYIGFSLGYKAQGLDRLVEPDGRSGRGQPLPGMSEAVVERISQLNQPPDWLYRWGNRIKNQDVELTSNVTYGALLKAVNEDGMEVEFGDLLQLASTPVYVVQSVERLEEQRETIDIALTHDDHDFLANGLLSHNTDPCYIYCLASNTLANNLTVVVHALAHNDFFKNNIFFSATNRGMMNKMANHGTRIRRYMARWGKERVTEFIDHVLRIEPLVDPLCAWDVREYKPARVKDERHWRFPERREVQDGHNYMEPWLNPHTHIDHEWEKIREKEAAEELGLMTNPVKNIFGFLKDHAPLKPWEQDIMSMLYEETMYFCPQGQTKCANEGWASYWDWKLMCGQGLISLGQPDEIAGGVIEYAQHKMGVLGGKYSLNPYKLGMLLLMEIEDRWNKGKFGYDYDHCRDIKQKENWDLKLGLGKQKIFEVRKHFNDLTLLTTFFDQEFCDKYEFFEWEKMPNGNVQIAEDGRNAKKIKKRLLERYVNHGLPEIRLTDNNHLGKGWLCLEHVSDGRSLHDPYARMTLGSLRSLWRNTVVLSTKGKDGREYVYVAEVQETDAIAKLDRATYERTFMRK